MRYKNVGILGTGSYLPLKKVTNQDIEKNVNTPVEKTFLDKVKSKIPQYFTVKYTQLKLKKTSFMINRSNKVIVRMNALKIYSVFLMDSSH